MEVHLRHTCDNPKCVNPAHLVSGTPGDNAKDMVERGRHRVPRGEKSHFAKLTDEQVLAIRADPRHSKVIAAEYELDATSVDKIKRLESWRHIVGPDPVITRRYMRPAVRLDVVAMNALFAKGLMQRDVAARLGVHESTVSRNKGRS